MNQPKFKFGDRVQNLITKNVFVVENIRKNILFTSEYIYNDIDEKNISEEDQVVLYQEPQKKKLYAYRNGSEVKFSTIQEPFLLQESLNPLETIRYVHAPAYDIEYPEGK